jgi:hypothetical protein
LFGNGSLPVGPRRGRIINLNQVPLVIAKRRKVSPPELSSRNGSGLVGRPRAKFEVVDVKKEETPVLTVVKLGYPNWTAQAAAVFILAIHGARRIKESARIEFVVPKIFVTRTMELVGAGTNDEPLDSSAGVSEFSRITGRREREFLYGVGRQRQYARISAHFRGSHAQTLNLDFLGEGLAAVYVGIESISCCSGSKKYERFRGAAAAGAYGQVDIRLRADCSSDLATLTL